MKSTAVSVMLPAFTWATDPAHRFLFSSYAESLAIRDSIKCRDIITSPWYRERWPHVQLKPDQSTKHRFDLTSTGYRIASSVGGGTGEGADTLIVDDAHALDDAYSEANREQALRWWSGTMSSRLNSKTTGARIIIGQRVHEADLIGKLIAETGWTYLCLPAEYVPTRTFSSPLGWKDPRKEAGELLWPERFPKSAQDQIKLETNAYTYSSQQQQDPQPDSGGMFSREHFRYFREEGGYFFLTLEDKTERRYGIGNLTLGQTFDTAIKLGQENDYTVCMTFGITPENDMLILDVVRLRIPVPSQYGFTLQMRAKHPGIAYAFVEDKASGQGLIQEGQKSRFPFLNLNERLKDRGINNLFSQDKSQRAVPVSILYENGKVYHRANAPWLVDYESELLHFPVGEFDDQVDAAAYAGICVRYGPRTRGEYVEASESGRHAALDRARLADFGMHPAIDETGRWPDDVPDPSPHSEWRQAMGL